MAKKGFKKKKSTEYCPTDQMVADYATKALQGKLFGNQRGFIMNLPEVKADELAACHMMRARSPSPETNEEQEPQVDAGPSFVGFDLQRMFSADLMPDEVLIDMGGTVQVTDPYYYQDALQDGIVHEVATSEMIITWFRNLEQDWNWPGNRRQAYHRGKPIRQLAYGNCYSCLRAGGLTQHCERCGGENRFHAMVLFDPLDIPSTVVDAKFLHRLVGYPDNQFEPAIDGTGPDGLGFLEDARRPITWPDESRNGFDWRADECLDFAKVQSIAESNGHPDWEARVRFLRLFQRGKFLSISRSTIEQIVQQEWIGAS